LNNEYLSIGINTKT